LTVLLLLVDLVGIAGLAVLLVLLANHLRLVLRGRSAAIIDEAPASIFQPGTAPRVLVQMPVYDEPASVPGLLEAVARLDWPRDRLTLQLLDDSTDATAAIAGAHIRALSTKGIEVQHVRRADRSGYKAGALAAGLSLSDAPYVAMLDADFRPPPDWLRRAVPVLEDDPKSAFVQFRFEVANRADNWMTAAQGLLVDAHFLVEQAGRAGAGEPFQFNGTAGVWRRRAIEEAGGWSADTLAEDLDLTLRAYLVGRHGRLALFPAIACEAPSDLLAWRRQQQRWSSGFLQVASRILPRIVRAPLPLRHKLAALLLLGIQLALPAFALAVAGFLGDMAIRGPGLGHALLLAALGAAGLATLVAITYPPYRRLRRGSLARYAVAAASLPALLGALAFANSAAVVKAPFAGRTEFLRTPKLGRH
jgi:cellulose synthase/poly-beta-1,6-N-acetylglucosamine synthase-like glycosyltransferase